MNHFRWTIGLIFTMAVLPGWLYGVEILRADPELTTRFAGKINTDAHFGTGHFANPKHGNHLLGFVYNEGAREVLPVFGFRMNEPFLREWKKQGLAQFIFSIIEFHKGDPRKICPIYIERLVSADSAAEAIASPPQKRLGKLSQNELQTGRLYAFPIAFQETLKPGDVVWIGLDSTKPSETGNNNLVISGDLSSFPGGSPPTLIAGSPEIASRTVHGITLLQLMNRSFYAPANEAAVPSSKMITPRWVNPLHTRRNLETLEFFHMVLKQELAKIPSRPVNVPDRFKGFHSSIKPENGTWELNFPIRKNSRTTSISLYPAACMNGEQVEAYAFPRRFTITAVPTNSGPAVTVADWSHADFPQQGLSPIIFPYTSGHYKEIRMTIHKGAPMPEGGSAFALSEVSFSRFNIDSIFLETTPEDRLDLLPYWSAAYATDGLTAFGSPAPSSAVSHGTYRREHQEENVAQLMIHHPKFRIWNSFEFHPTQNVNGLPPEDFPRSILIEFYKHNPDKIVQTVHTSTKQISMPKGEYPFVLQFPPVLARSARITLNPDHPNEPLQLEEITINGGLPLQLDKWYGKKKDISGSPGTTALYDRIINGHWHYPPIRRAVNLIRRDILSEEIQKIKLSMEAIHRAHERTVAWLVKIVVSLASLLLCLIIIYQRKMHRRIFHRIQQDLHDEIGSQLSTISLISNFNKNAPTLDPELCTELADINLSAREAIASLAEVIWVTDKELLSLEQCLDIMKKRAEKMVHTMQLEVDFPQKVRSLELPYKSKRNLILFFTEALNNALKHSNADTIRVSARLNDQRQLTLIIHDNGQGFSPEIESDGIGLESMKERARKLGGQLDITSSPDQGTTVTLRCKLITRYRFIKRSDDAC